MPQLKLTTGYHRVCGCCEQVIDPERRKDDALCAALFGAVAYAQCPICYMEVPPHIQTPRYKRCVDKHAADRAKG